VPDTGPPAPSTEQVARVLRLLRRVEGIELRASMDRTSMAKTRKAPEFFAHELERSG
jgi:hypothetical protein